MTEPGKNSEAAGAPTGEAGELAAGTDPHFALTSHHERRTEILVALSFWLAIACIIALAVVYSIGGQPQAEGALLGLGMFSMGAGIIAWGKYLVPQGPFKQEREPLASSPEVRQAFAESFKRADTVVGRRTMLVKLMAATMTVFGAFLVFPLRSLGPQPKKLLDTTPWRPRARLVRADGRVVNTADLEVGGILTVFPENDPGGAISQTVLLHVSSQDITTQPGRETWGPQGFLAFSRVCTHAGCPVSLYEQDTQQLLCPCHQSLFNVLDGAKPIFGPAPRPLAQLPLMIDPDGVIRAQKGYDEPVGPGFWERGKGPA